MKKKPELLKRSGKSSLTLRNFLNNLKENDLHYENKQITQCVFLGVLRLKPVPSIFSKNNVPSVSAPVENKPKKVKNNNSNKAHNKNVSRKNDINKVISGKVTKKNSQKVKAAVKKVPDKKPTFKIKLNTKKKTSKAKKIVHPSPNDEREALTESPESSQAVPCDPVPSTRAIGLNPLEIPTKFNPVQNLFNKLKQKIDSTHTEPGPSTVPKQTNKTVDGPGPSEELRKVCKINAKRQVNSTANASKKSKKAVQRKSVNHERLSMPLKPASSIIISDSDSTGKKDDVIIVDENNCLNGQAVAKEIIVESGTTSGATDDVIFVKEDPKTVIPRERSSPRNKTVIPIQDNAATTDHFEKHGIIVINDEQKSTKAKRRSPPKASESRAEAHKHQSSDIIVISDEPKAKEIVRSSVNVGINNTMEKDNSCKGQEGSENNVIIIDEIREFRTSPRMKNTEAVQENSKKVQSFNTNLQEQQAAVDEVIVVTEEANMIPKVNKTHTPHDKIKNYSEKSVRDKSKTQELNITIDNHQNVKNKDQTSPRLLKVVDKVDKNISAAVKKELIESNGTEVRVVNDKPRQRKPKPLIPPMFLNAPMLLRSELAPKKTTPQEIPEKPKRKERSTSKLLRSDMGHAKNLKNPSVKLNEKTSIAESENSNLKPQNKYSKFLRPESSYKKKSDSVSLLSDPQASSASEEVIFVAENTKKSNEKCSSRTLKLGRPEKSAEKMQKIDLVTEVERSLPDSLHRSDLLEMTNVEPSHSRIQENNRDDVIILNEEPVNEQVQAISKRLLRSEFAQQRSPDTVLKKSREHVMKPKQKSPKIILEGPDEDVIIMEELKPTKKHSPRLLRSDLAKQKISGSSPAEDRGAPIKGEEVQKESSKQKIIDISPRENNLENSVNEVQILDPQDLVNSPSGPEKHSNVQSFGEIDEEIMIVKELKPKKVSPRTLRSDIPEIIKVESPEPNKSSRDLLVISNNQVPSQKHKASPRFLKSEIAQQKTRTKSPQKNKQIDLDEIIVVNEKQAKKPIETTTSGRLLRSELALQKSRERLQVKTEVEEVVVLIHDEPKPKQNTSPKSESLQKNNKINIQDDVIVLTEESPPSKLSPMSLRSDTNQKHSPEKISPKTKPLPSNDVQEKAKAVEQNVHNLPNDYLVEAKVEKQRLEIISITNSQIVSKDELACSKIADKEQIQKQTFTTRSHKSPEAQHSPKNMSMEEFKNSPSTSLEKQNLKSEVTPRRSPRTHDQPVIIDVDEVSVIEQTTSQSKLLSSQQSHQNLLEESAGLIVRQKLLISEITEKSSLSIPVDQSGNCEKQMENLFSTRLLRSVASKGPLDSQVKPKVRKRLSKSEITNVNLSTICDAGPDIRVESDPLVQSIETSETQPKIQPAEKNPPKEEFGIIEVIDDRVFESPRLLRSDISSQKSPTILSKQSESAETTAIISKSDITMRRSLPEPPGKDYAETKVKKGRARKTKSLLIDSKAKLKTPMLLRSELAQLKNVNVNTSNQDGVKNQKKRGRKPKVTPPPSNVEVPAQELSPKVQASKSKVPKRKSLIDDLKRKNLPKQKANAVQAQEISPKVPTSKGKSPKRKTLINDVNRKNSPKQKAMEGLKSNPAVISEPKIISAEVSEIPMVNNENGIKTVDNNLPGSVAIEMKTEEKPMETVLKSDNKVLDAPKGVKSKKKVKENTPEDLADKVKVQNDPNSVIPKLNIKEGSGKEPTKQPVECKTKIQDSPKIDIEKASERDTLESITEHPLKSKNTGLRAPRSVKPKKKTEENSTKNPLKRRSNSQESLKSAKPKLLKNTGAHTKLNGALAKSPPEEIDPQTSEKNPPKKYKRSSLAKRKLKTSKAIESVTSPETPLSNGNIPDQVKRCKTPERTPKKMDTTVFDFDETEPEVVPLRLTSPRRNRKVTPEISKESEPSKSNVGITPKTKKQKLMVNKTKTDDSETKAQAKAKLLAMFGDKSPRKDNLESPGKPKGKSTKTKCASKTRVDKEQSLALPSPSPKKAENTKKDKKISAPDETNTSPAKSATSPMKQTTITDMFNKVLVKKEKAAAAESVFGPTPGDIPPPEEPLKETTNENTITDMAPPKFEKKVIPSVKNEEEENGVYDDDSDCESRVEWIPEEYAEYKFKYSAKKMMNTFTKPIIHKCKICLLILPTYYRLVKHKKQHAKTPNPYICPQCDAAFPSIEDLTPHLRIHKGKHPFACNKCDIGFFSRKELDEHTPIHVLRKIKQPNKRFRCDVCAKEFSKLCDMERHTRVHTGEKPCVCNICNKRFQQSHNLSKHLLTHLHVKPYHCEICNKQFGRNDVLNRHLLTHSIEKPIKCPLCSKGFIRQSQLNNHMRKTHPDAAKIEAMEDDEPVETKVEIN